MEAKEYCIVENKDLTDLQISVDNLIEAGWQPISGVAVELQESKGKITQLYLLAMILPELPE